ncbi:BCCT family transporter [Oleiagrimonas sp. C23AA]|uniref:BCCT family transporter n=1 Tax=Oleiagrimonas sp. C23AA TaxID=2719047 RepID=UPI00141E551A|nr:BCCT family transporter [Oleiagrimonas sp. C23AA]NII09570.1 BCCT family transporter [Oleiagrimonas sp. C23AA]
MSTITSYLKKHTNPPVFLISGALLILMVAAASIFPDTFSSAADATQNFIATYFGWFYIFSTTIFLIFVVVIALSRWGKLRLGKDDSTPEYDTWSWISMMFTAGMGIGLVYYGVSEPLMHFKNPPVVQGGTPQAAESAMNYTFFHWGLHPWAIYIVLGLALGYFSFRKGLPLRPASAFYPLIGDRINGPIGHLIDILAVFGTLFGLATSIGLGASQIAAGLNDLFGVSDGLSTQLLVIGVVEAIAIVSVMLGVDAGIRRLSVINMWLAIALAIFVFIVGPTLYLLSNMATDTGYYLQHLVQTSLNIFSDEKGQKFQKAWTLFYWGWWISWSPFVGMFIARISYGYTIRQFILGTLLIPTGASLVWFVIFGRTALFHMLHGSDAALMNADASHAIFVLMDQLPVGQIVAGAASVLTIIVVTLFFATSSDSGSLVVDILTNGGDPDPIWQQRLFWAVMEGAVAAVLLIAGTVGGATQGKDPLSALQTAAVTSGLPFCLVLLLMCWSLTKALKQDDGVAALPKLKFAEPPHRQS